MRTTRTTEAKKKKMTKRRTNPNETYRAKAGLSSTLSCPKAIQFFRIATVKIVPLPVVDEAHNTSPKGTLLSHLARKSETKLFRQRLPRRMDQCLRCESIISYIPHSRIIGRLS